MPRIEYIQKSSIIFTLRQSRMLTLKVQDVHFSCNSELNPQLSMSITHSLQYPSLHFSTTPWTLLTCRP